MEKKIIGEREKKFNSISSIKLKAKCLGLEHKDTDSTNDTYYLPSLCAKVVELRSALLPIRLTTDGTGSCHSK